MNKGNIIEVIDLCKSYGKGFSLVKALDHISLTIEEGTFTAIVGASGSGKSTLLHMMGGLTARTAARSLWQEGIYPGFLRNRLLSTAGEILELYFRIII